MRFSFRQIAVINSQIWYIHTDRSKLYFKLASHYKSTRGILILVTLAKKWLKFENFEIVWWYLVPDVCSHLSTEWNKNAYFLASWGPDTLMMCDAYRENRLLWKYTTCFLYTYFIRWSALYVCNVLWWNLIRKFLSAHDMMKSAYSCLFMPRFAWQRHQVST